MFDESFAVLDFAFQRGENEQKIGSINEQHALVSVKKSKQDNGSWSGQDNLLNSNDQEGTEDLTEEAAHELEC